jgi:hypothetical protein
MYLNFISDFEGSLVLTILFFRDNINDEEESKTDSEDEVDLENESDFQYDNGNPAQPVYETDSQSIGMMSDIEAGADEEGEVLDGGEGGQGEKLVVDSMAWVRNSEDVSEMIAISQMMEGVTEPSTDDSVSSSN